MIALKIVGFLLLIGGLVGCVLPVIPGPPLSYMALILLQIVTHGSAFTSGELIFWGVVTVVVTIFDYVIPVVGAKKFGASKYGIWGSVLGMVVGIVFFPPLGMIVGAFIGAVGAEIIVGKHTPAALKAGWGTFIGTMSGIVIKIMVSGMMTFYYIKALF